MEEDITYGVEIKFNKTKAEIHFENEPGANQFAHGIALLVLALNNQVEGDLQNTILGVVDAINNIKD